MLILNGLFAQPYKRDKLLRFDNSQFKKKKDLGYLSKILMPV